MRVKLAARGGGAGIIRRLSVEIWPDGRRDSAGLEELKTRGMEDCFQLLHFHLGSQIPNIRIVKGALNEAARVYVELVKAGAGLKYMDVGGGLGVDYDGSQTNFESSVNYTLEEYANDVVYHLQTVCDEAQGAASHHRVGKRPGHRCASQLLVFNVLGISGFGDEVRPEGADPRDGTQPLLDLMETYEGMTSRNAAESYHDAQQALDMAMNLSRPAICRSINGRLPRISTGRFCLKLQKLAQAMDEVARGPSEPRRVACRIPISATSRSSSPFPTAGPSSSSFPSCRSTA